MHGNIFRTDDERVYRCENHLVCPGNWLYKADGTMAENSWNNSYALSIPYGGNVTFASPYGSEEEDASERPRYRLTNEPLEVDIINPGTVRAPLTIWIAGNLGDGVTVVNETTGQEFEITGVTYDNTTNLNQIENTWTGSIIKYGRYFVYDSKYGTAEFRYDNEFDPQAESAYLNHNGGSIELEPANYYGGYNGIFKLRTLDDGAPYTLVLNDDCGKRFAPQDQPAQHKIVTFKFTLSYPEYQTGVTYNEHDRISFKNRHYACVGETMQDPEEAPDKWSQITYSERMYADSALYGIQTPVSLSSAYSFNEEDVPYANECNEHGIKCEAAFCTVNKIKIIPKNVWHYTNVSLRFNPTFY